MERRGEGGMICSQRVGGGQTLHPHFGREVLIKDDFHSCFPHNRLIRYIDDNSV